MLFGQGGCARKDDRRGEAKADSDHDRLRQTCRRQYGSSTQSVRRNPHRINRSRSGIGRSTRTCKYTTDAIVAEGTEKGELRKVCAHADCPVHHPKKQANAGDAKWKAEQEKQRKQEAIARATGLRVLGAIGDAVPVRLLKRELLFIALQMAAKLDLQRMETLAKLHRLPVQKGGETLHKTLVTFLRGSGEGMLGRLLVEMAILLRADSEQAGSKVLAEAAKEYSIDVDSISAAVNKEFAERDKAKAAKKTTVKPQGKAAKKTAAA